MVLSKIYFNILMSIKKPRKPMSIKKPRKPKRKGKPGKSNKLRFDFSNKKKKQCNGDSECLSGIKKKYGVNEIYSKPEGFGFMIQAPKNSPFSKKDFKPKCMGVQTYKSYKDTKADPKTFGSLLTKLNKSLYFPKQANSDCYETRETTTKRKEYGSTCYNDKECLTNKCSNIKFLGTPGKCILPKSPNSSHEGDKCIYKGDCKDGLICKKNKKRKNVKGQPDYGLCKRKDKSFLGKNEKSILDYVPSGILRKIGPKSKKKNKISASASASASASKCSETQDTLREKIDGDEYLSFDDTDTDGKPIKCTDITCHKDCKKK